MDLALEVHPGLPPRRVEIGAEVLQLAAGPDAGTDDLAALGVALFDDVMRVVMRAGTNLKRRRAFEVGELGSQRQNPVVVERDRLLEAE
jgi:hypothetical protein